MLAIAREVLQTKVISSRIRVFIALLEVKGEGTNSATVCGLWYSWMDVVRVPQNLWVKGKYVEFL